MKSRCQDATTELESNRNLGKTNLIFLGGTIRYILQQLTVSYPPSFGRTQSNMRHKPNSEFFFDIPFMGDEGVVVRNILLRFWKVLSNLFFGQNPSWSVIAR